MKAPHETSRSLRGFNLFNSDFYQTSTSVSFMLEQLANTHIGHQNNNTNHDGFHFTSPKLEGRAAVSMWANRANVAAQSGDRPSLGRTCFSEFHLFCTYCSFSTLNTPLLCKYGSLQEIHQQRATCPLFSLLKCDQSQTNKAAGCVWEITNNQV